MSKPRQPNHQAQAPGPPLPNHAELCNPRWQRQAGQPYRLPLSNGQTQHEPPNHRRRGMY